MAPAVGLPTGTGKTIVFSQLAEERKHLGRTLILAHRDELLRQAADKYREINPAVDIGFVQAGTNDIDHDVVIASVQSLSRQRRIDEFPFDLFATAVIDEAHHAVAATYRRIIDARAPGSLLVGVSATLERGDRVGLGAVWERVVYFKDIREMIAAGYLVDVRAYAVRLAYDMGKLRVSRGDFVGRDVEGMLNATHAYSVAANSYLEHADGRKAIIFTPTVVAAHQMAATFSAAGVPAEAVDGLMDISDRRAVLDRFASGETRVVANAMVLTEGYDEPSVGCIIVARPTRSRPLYVQMVGRGTRLHPGKDDLVVLDLVGNSDRLDIMSLPKMFGLRPGSCEKEGAVRILAQGPAKLAGLWDPTASGAGMEVANLFERKDLNWLRLEDGSWLLNLGDLGDIFLHPRPAERWDAIRREKGGRNVSLGEGLDIGYAMGVAEEFLRSNQDSSVKALVDKTAPWRAKPPSGKQVAFLHQHGIPVTDGLTKGEASDLISAAIARDKRRRVA
jgi:hypothetical protein